MISEQGKQAVNQLIIERAFEISEKLKDDDFFLANIAGLKPEQVDDVSLKCAIKELKGVFADV